MSARNLPLEVAGHASSWRIETSGIPVLPSAARDATGDVRDVIHGESEVLQDDRARR